MTAQNLPPIDWIERAILIDSRTDQSNEEMVAFLTPLLQETGLHIYEQRVVEDGKVFKNLVGFSHDLDSPDMLALNTHLDTVSGGSDSDWTKTGGNPFRATLDGDRIYGLGAADVKLDFLCKIIAARLAKPWGRPFSLIGTFGEERGLVGAAHLFREKKVRPTYALVGEPSNLELIYAHKGHLVCVARFDLGVDNVRFIEKPVQKTWKGRAAHSSTPQLGKNALSEAFKELRVKKRGIVSLTAGHSSNAVPDSCEALFVPRVTGETKRLLDFVDKLEKFSKTLSKKKDPRFSPATNTLSLNLARTKQGQCQLTFDIRCLPGLDAEKLRNSVTDLVEGCGGTLDFLEVDAPLDGNKKGKFITAAAKALKACGTKPVVKTKASSTEAAVYRQNGVEAIVFGPGLSVGNVHRPNEYNSLKQMEVATCFYRAMLSMKPGEF